jgi:response regulator RpfG family c-di-GMP phosphodiesterase
MPDTPPFARALSNQVIGVNDVRRVLVVDDEETIRLAMARFLRARGYDVETADSGPGALRQLQQRKFELMLCDVKMPDMSGIELVPQALSIDPELAIMMLSAVNDPSTATEVLARGAMDYLTKPVELGDLQHAVERVLHRRDLQIEQRNVERLIEEEVSVRSALLARESDIVRRTSLQVIETLVDAHEAKFPFFHGHSQRVAELSSAIARELGLDADLVGDIGVAGRLHDVGMIGVRESVVSKAGLLTGEELAHVRDHVGLGVEILAPLRHLGIVLVFVQDHHERWDGSGYPRGLAGEEISIGGRILNAADTYDALTSDRPQRLAMSSDAALAFMSGDAKALIDPMVLRALLSIVVAV